MNPTHNTQVDKLLADLGAAHRFLSTPRHRPLSSAAQDHTEIPEEVAPEQIEKSEVVPLSCFARTEETLDDLVRKSLERSKMALAASESSRRSGVLAVSGEEEGKDGTGGSQEKELILSV